VVFDVFPAKVLELQKLILETSSPASPFDVSHVATFTDTTVYPSSTSSSNEPDSKKRRLSIDGTSKPSNDSGGARYAQQVIANHHLTRVHQEIKKQCEDLTSSCDKVKLWVNLSMPRIEDGDNFGVQVQEECLNELHRSQECSLTFRDSARTHFLARAKIASKLIKYPNIEDYALALREHDEKQLFMARQHLHDLRNIYAVLTDMLHKNIAKLRAPKGNNSSALY